jgi:UDP-N-acetylmuramoylalanine--D-glutamate ligase
MARSGLAAAQVLAERGACVTLFDSKPAAELEEALQRAGAMGIAAITGVNAVGDADLLVTSPGVRKSAPVLQNAVARGIPVWGEIEAAYRVACAPILAITGTNGKTTTTMLLGEMMRAGGFETFVAGNIAAGEVAMPLIMAAHRAPESAVIVAEISSFQLEWIEAFRPKVAALLNITADHLDRQTWEEYVASKWRIFENQGLADFAVTRRDIPTPESPEPKLAAQVVFYDESPRPSWLADLKLPGRHNADNVLAASCMARAMGVDEAVIERAATGFPGVVHRLEYVATVAGVRYINNSMCTNTAAFAQSLAALPEAKIVLTGGVYKGGDILPLAEAVVRNNVRRLVLYGQSASEIEDAVRAKHFESIRRVQTLSEAVALAGELARPGETVVLNPGCASFDQFRDFEDRGDTFKNLVAELAQRSPIAC